MSHGNGGPAPQQETPGEGNPTPSRRVQWATSHKINKFRTVALRPELVNDDDHDEESSRALDEKGKDPAAFAKLHKSLEYYVQATSGSKPAPRAINTPRLKQASDTPVMQIGPRAPKAESSRQSALRANPRFYIQDSDDDLNLPGMPLPISSGAEDEDEDEDEDAAMEERGNKERKLWEQRARSLVKAYSRLGRGEYQSEDESMRLRRRWPPSTVGNEEKSRHPHHPIDVEANVRGAHLNIEPLPLGRNHGILSTLLSLYQHSRSGSRLEVASFAASNTDLESKIDSTFERGRTRYRQNDEPMSRSNARAASVSRLYPSSSTMPYPGRARSVSPLDLPASPISLPGTPRNESQNVKLRTSFIRSIRTPHLPLAALNPSEASPKAAKSSGGVVAALIATANNLAGPAAPVPSSVGPMVSKKGFRLSRYELSPEAPSRCASQQKNSSSMTITPASTPYTLTPSNPSASTSGLSTPSTIGEKSKKSTISTLSDWIPRTSSLSLITTPFEGTRAQDEAGSKTQEDGREHGRSYRKVKNDRRRKAEIYITKHVAEILQRQEFILKLARALIMFAAPGHRLQAQLKSTARVLDMDISTVYFPNVLLISFDDTLTSTSNVKILQQGSTLNMDKLLYTHRLYWKVIHDEISVSSASASLDLLMRSPPRYCDWQIVVFGGLCSSSICSLSFSGSFVDSLVAFPLGCLLVIVQIVSARNELYSNVFEITIATVLSFISAALASTRKFCYAAVASSSVVLILPGFLVLSGSLELASRQMVSGAVRICFAIMYALFLGFGLAIGSEFYSRMTGLHVVGPDDVLCGSVHHATGPWWQRRVPLVWAFLTVPLFSFSLSLRNHASIFRKEMLMTVLISCAGWTANHYAGVAFKGRSDIQSAVGAFAVGIIANIYAKFFSGNAYVVMITGILFQLPSGLAGGGLLTFAATDDANHPFQSYRAGFQVALQLVAVAVGLTVGLFTSVVIVHPLGGSRRRSTGLFSL